MAPPSFGGISAEPRRAAKPGGNKPKLPFFQKQPRAPGRQPEFVSVSFRSLSFMFDSVHISQARNACRGSNLAIAGRRKHPDRELRAGFKQPRGGADAHTLHKFSAC